LKSFRAASSERRTKGFNRRFFYKVAPFVQHQALLRKRFDSEQTARTGNRFDPFVAHAGEGTHEPK
jgi:hypothetical protein